MPADRKTIEEGDDFTPGFDQNGLITVVAQDAKTNEILMVACMNQEALKQTIATGTATYYSRSRKKLWKKGEQSGHIQKVEQMLVDCDQDCIILKVSVEAGQCHVGYDSCFYRAVKTDNPSKLRFIAAKSYDPQKTYRK